MALNVLATYRNAVKPVGEKILFNYNPDAAAKALWNAAGKSVSYDFEIDADYFVTQLAVTKTVLPISATQTDDAYVDVLRVNTDATTDLIARVYLICTAIIGGGLKGAKTIAGEAGVAVVRPIGNTTITTEHFGSAASVLADPLVKVAATKSVAAAANNKQKIRITLTAGPTPQVDATLDMNMLVEVQLAKFSEVVSVNGLGGELVTPPFGYINPA